MAAMTVSTVSSLLKTIDPLHKRSRTLNSPLAEVNEELSSAESCAQRVHACTVPLFDIKNGDQCKESDLLRSKFVPNQFHSSLSQHPHVQACIVSADLIWGFSAALLSIAINQIQSLAALGFSLFILL